MNARAEIRWQDPRAVRAFIWCHVLATLALFALVQQWIFEPLIVLTFFSSYCFPILISISVYCSDGRYRGALLASISLCLVQVMIMLPTVQ